MIAIPKRRSLSKRPDRDPGSMIFFRKDSATSSIISPFSPDLLSKEGIWKRNVRVLERLFPPFSNTIRIQFREFLTCFGTQIETRRHSEIVSTRIRVRLG